METVVSTKLYSEDAERLQEIAKENGISKSELLRMLIYEFLDKETDLKSELKRIKEDNLKRCEYLKKIYGLVGRLSNYSNQIARAVNTMARNQTATREEREDFKEIFKVAGEIFIVAQQVEEFLNGFCGEDSE